MLHYFHNPLCACNHPNNLQEKLIPLLQSIFTSLFHPYLITKLSLQSPLTFALCLSNFSPLNNLNQKLFSLLQLFSQFRLHQWNMELGSSARTNTALISPFFHNHWFCINKAEKISVLQIVLSDEDACNWNGKPFNLPSLIPSTYYYYFHTLLIQ